MKVSIIGVTGYGGMELVRLLLQHPEVEIISLHSHSQSGKTVNEVLPQLKKLIDLPIETIDTKQIMKNAELVFLATPSGVSKTIASDFIAAEFPMIDLSGDFRLKEPVQYEKWYKNSSVQENYLEKFDYGLADIKSEYAKKFIANPGCYATGTLLSLAPLVQTTNIDVNSIIVDGKSGLSGAGKNLTEASHFVAVNENMSLYKMNSHQHIPEVIQQLKEWNQEISAIQFSTSLIPVTRGIFITTYVKSKQLFENGEVEKLFRTFYQDNYFVRVQDPESYPSLKQVIGSNFCDIGVAYNPATKIITVVTVLDNLVKGAAGQAIQNLNKLAGWPEELGLKMCPMYI